MKMFSVKCHYIVCVNTDFYCCIIMILFEKIYNELSSGILNYKTYTKLNIFNEINNLV